VRDEVANVAFPILDAGLSLKESLQKGARKELASEQARLRTMLGRVDGSGNVDPFLGFRYALACWLDEIFTSADSLWLGEWKDSKLETALYRTNDRAWKFLEQAELALARWEENDDLEVFLLCVMLGFRGNWSTEQPRWKQWFDEAQHRLDQAQKEAKDLRELPPPTELGPLRGKEQWQRVLLVLWGLLLLLAPFIGFVLVLTELGQR
jgi:type VI secretion system protein ImpK